MFDKDNFKANISEIIAKVSEKSHEDVGATVTDAEGDTIAVIVNNIKTFNHKVVAIFTDAEGDTITVIVKNTENLKHIAFALSEADYIVEFCGDGCNFLRVRPNPCPTPKEYVITHIPISFIEAIALVKNAGFGVVEDIRNGIKHVTVVGYSNAQHDDISKIVSTLCAGGIILKYLGVGNFFEFDEVQSSPAFVKDAMVKIA